ncbi:uncharacterized protein LOC129582854 [Paramacrobiotus metropolitanus]|uniref:uncharacterized protein LOC129582854 n=1 Tax=Paramacrobiotus metropolitanus TaxID=2943436 RepID=UPI00244611F0|nr:uncharacterized protein LOC129582854 [Paramacrobiotus metropolitanus]
MKLYIIMNRTRLPLSGDPASSVWAALEGALSVTGVKDMEALSKWLTMITTEEGYELHRKAVGNVLCTTQTADPRTSLHYREKKWCAEGLQDLRLEELSRIAQRFLLILPDFLRNCLSPG